MSTEKEEEKSILPHHEQLPLCVTRLPYRQGRKLTAVKVYTVNNESAHLLIFGVPSLNLRREAKELFVKFGRLIKFNLMKDYAVEQFTETYHAYYDRIQSARIAKKMLDTRSFYGGSLHICYAPELETLEETRNKLIQRKKDVLYRLKNLQKEANESKMQEKVENDLHMKTNDTISNENDSYMHKTYNFVSNSSSVTQNVFNVERKTQIGPILDEQSKSFEKTEIVNEIGPKYDLYIENNTILNTNDSKKLNMAETNIIYLNQSKKKRKKKEIATKKRLKHGDERKLSNEESFTKDDTDIIDCTSTEKEVVSNINEALNYNNFGNEIIKKVEDKPLNKIVFNLNKKPH